MHAYSKDPTRMAAFAPSSSRSTKAAIAGALARAWRWLAQTWLAKVASALTRERRTRLAIDELKSFDDHMLRDIGLERIDIEGAVRGQFRPLSRELEAPPHPDRGRAP